MALGDLYSNLHLIFRWLHVIAGIVWIGHLYFFNFVNVPFQGAIDDATKKAVNAKLMLRALWWFRWGAMTTFLAGLVLFTMNYMYTPGVGFGPTSLFSDESGLTGRAVWILFGTGLGTIMWFNVWFVIWPIQKKIFAGKAPADKVAGMRKNALLASRVNTFLSGPMLFGMLAPAHYGAINGVTIAVFILIAILPIWWAIRTSFKVGTSV